LQFKKGEKMKKYKKMHKMFFVFFILVFFHICCTACDEDNDCQDKDCESNFADTNNTINNGDEGNNFDTSKDAETDADTDISTNEDTDTIKDTGTNTDISTDSDIDTETSNEIANCLETTAFVPNTSTEVLLLSGPDIEAGLIRYDDPDMGGTSGTIPWIGERFALIHQDVILCVTDEESLDYQGSYHNFDDSFVITHNGTIYTLDIQRPGGYSSAVIFTLSAKGAYAFAPVELSLDKCTNLFSQTDCLTRYKASP
jgi:hypothetical protein